MKLSITELYYLQHLVEEDIRAATYYRANKSYYNRCVKVLNLIKLEINQLKQQELVI